MNIEKLERCLIEEGCNPNNYAVGSRGMASDAFCLTQETGTWRVYYTERGKDDDPMFESTSESEACDYFFSYIMSFRHDHCVGFFRSEQRATELSAELERHGVDSFRDKIPYGGWEDPRHRVFVTGKAIFKTRELIGDAIVED